MSRLKQLNPGNYRSGERINADFEQIVRYVNAAELGDKTIGELLAILFNEEGEFAGPIELRLDTADGLQYRIGTYEDSDDGWTTIAELEQIRGPAGSDVGELLGPIIADREDYTATASQTVFSYAFDTEDDVLVFKNGLLQAEAAYTKSAANDTVTFGAGLSLNDRVSIFKIRAQAIANYDRTDITASASQAVFPFVHDDTQSFMVFKNGILQRTGGGNDYTSDADSDTITFTSACSANDIISIVTVEDGAVRAVTGLLTEDSWTDGLGFIPLNRISIDDDAIPQEKVNGLAAALSGVARITFSATEPTGPSASDLWVDSASSPNVLKFYNGVAWLATTSAVDIPDFALTDAGKFLRINGSGTDLEFADLDLSAVVAIADIDAPNGVAGLDADGLITTSRLPTAATNTEMSIEQTGSVSDATYNFRRIYKRKLRIDHIVYKLTSGTCTLQLSVDGSTVGTTYSATSSLQVASLSPTITVDASSVAKLISVVVSSGSSPVLLQVTLLCTTVEGD